MEIDELKLKIELYLMNNSLKFQLNLNIPFGPILFCISIGNAFSKSTTSLQYPAALFLLVYEHLSYSVELYWDAFCAKKWKHWLDKSDCKTLVSDIIG